MVDVQGKRAGGSAFVKKVERSAGRVELDGDAEELDLTALAKCEKLFDLRLRGPLQTLDLEPLARCPALRLDLTPLGSSLRGLIIRRTPLATLDLTPLARVKTFTHIQVDDSIRLELDPAVKVLSPALKALRASGRLG